MTGWRMGWIVYPASAHRRVREADPVQHLRRLRLSAARRDRGAGAGRGVRGELRCTLPRRREVVARRLGRMQRLRVVPAEGSFYSHVRGRRCHRHDAVLQARGARGGHRPLPRAPRSVPAPNGISVCAAPRAPICWRPQWIGWSISSRTMSRTRTRRSRAGQTRNWADWGKGHRQTRKWSAQPITWPVVGAILRQ